MKEEENMRSFYRLIHKKSVIAVVIIFILTTAGILSEAGEDTAPIVQAKTVRESANVTASVDNASPLQNTNVNISVAGPAGAAVKLVCHFKSKDISYSAVLGTDGKAVIPLWVGEASSGYAVVVDVSVISDKTYTTQTMFIPQ